MLISYFSSNTKRQNFAVVDAAFGYSIIYCAKLSLLFTVARGITQILFSLLITSSSVKVLNCQMKDFLHFVLNEDSDVVQHDLLKFPFFLTFSCSAHFHCTSSKFLKTFWLFYPTWIFHTAHDLQRVYKSRKHKFIVGLQDRSKMLDLTQLNGIWCEKRVFVKPSNLHDSQIVQLWKHNKNELNNT